MSENSFSQFNKFSHADGLKSIPLLKKKFAEHPGLGSAPLHRWRFRTLDLHAMWRAPRAIGQARPSIIGSYDHRLAETVLKRWRRCTGHFREAYRLHSYSGKGCQPRF